MNNHDELSSVLDEFDIWCKCGHQECVKFDNYNEAKQAIQRMIDRAVLEARIDELNNLNTPDGEIYSSLTKSGTGTWLDRISELKSQGRRRAQEGTEKR